MEIHVTLAEKLHKSFGVVYELSPSEKADEILTGKVHKPIISKATRKIKKLFQTQPS